MAWFIVTLVVPGVTPAFFFWLLWAVKWNRRRDVHPFLMVKDGQLGWSTIALCSAALLEVPAGWPIVRGLLVLLIIVSAMWAVVGAMEPVPYPDTPPGGRNLWRLSLTAYVAASATFAFVHYQAWSFS
ncbi:hypothetical protein [Luteibacter yeojuensis]|uniref:Uncharacterized protein n=1 Tax=Luteibacter yeojuensis TaxID=345309 RepID=A0A0F3KNA3_9GAMM|nr:hypothetical protein [Luteibacter yeojuensis]KJV32467.1 hypothetical protein VI08_12010 [Luteibacter yeojuensis]